MMKLLFSTCRGTKGLSFLLLMIMLTSHKGTAKQFKCHFDLCDTDEGQYCDESEGELRCKYCSATCDLGPVIPECQEVCARRMVTTETVTTEGVATEMITTEMVTTEMETTTELPVLTENTHTNALISIVSILLVFSITGFIIVGYLFATKKYCFAKPQKPTSSAVSSKDTLIVINEESLGTEMDNSPIFKKKKLPIEEQGIKRFDDSKQLHTRPTLDDDPELHRLIMDDPLDIAILENKSQRDEETLPKHTLC